MTLMLTSKNLRVIKRKQKLKAVKITDSIFKVGVRILASQINLTFGKMLNFTMHNKPNITTIAD